MDREEFVAALTLLAKRTVPGTVDVLRTPPGRGPWPSLVRQSEWFNGLAEGDQAMVAEVMDVAAYGAVHAVFCAFDGITAIDLDHGDFVLQHSAPDGTVTLLHGPDSNASLDELHSLMQDTWFPFA